MERDQKEEGPFLTLFSFREEWWAEFDGWPMTTYSSYEELMKALENFTNEFGEFTIYRKIEKVHIVK